MKKRILSMLLTSAMVVSLLAGCGSAQEAAAPAADAAPAAEQEDAAEEVAEEATEKASSDEPAEIYMFISSPEYADAINELIEEYKTVAPNVTINYETTQSDYPTLLKAKINSGEVPDIFASTSGMEIDTYLEYSYDLSGEPIADAMSDSVKSVMASTQEGGGVYGLAIKGNWFGCVYNQAIFDEVGVAYPTTYEELEAACEAISAAGYKPFSTGFGEWWVWKHLAQQFESAAAEKAGITTGALADKFKAGEAHISDYPEMYDDFFKFVDLAVKYGDDKPLESTLSTEEAAVASGEAAMMIGQGAWVEADCLAINPDFKLGFNGYPVNDDPSLTKVVAGSDQALRVYKDSPNLQAVLDFVNWWYTSDYAETWFNDVAGVVLPIKSDAPSSFEVINQGNALAAANGTADLGISYDTDSFHQVFGETMQAYVAGTMTKDEACKEIEAQWAAIDGQQ